MIYLQPHSRPYQRFSRLIAIFFAALVLLCIALIMLAPHFFSSVFTSIARPFWRIQFSVESGSLSSPERLLAENERLKLEIEKLRVSSEGSVFLISENEEFRTLLGRTVSPASASSSIRLDAGVASGILEEGAILAAVLKRPPASPYDVLIIDVGYADGVSTTSAVYAPGNILIGRVIDVLKDTSKVKLYSSPEEKYDVLIGANRTPAVAVGRGGGHYEAQISRESGVKEGDYVMSNGLNDGPFGLVNSIISDPAQAFQTVLFSPMTNIYEIRWVLVKN
ncbi:MAG: rod shape-determining protein MreC [Candidatus Pacebacteria bacterium]|nr:rod shape-determining protein MreC [Candidatus Paceibacterota bacterium]